MTKRVRITLVRSTIGQREPVRRTVRFLGLRKLHSMVEKDGSPAVLGMVRAVSHLVRVEELG